MSVINEQFTISTKGFDDIIDITLKIQNIISFNNIVNGLVNIDLIASTASVITMEYEPGMVIDLADRMNKLVSSDSIFNHDKAWDTNNGQAHLKSILLGKNITLNIIEGKIELDTWQKIVLIDFDKRPRIRKVSINILT